MGKAYSSLIRRPLKNWNIANRAERELMRDKPIVSPRHPSTKANLEQFEREHPELLEAQRVKDDKLLHNLQDLVVEPSKFGAIISSTKPLPQSREKFLDPEYGYLEPEHIPDGRCSIRQALEFITSHQVSPELYPASKIAGSHKLDVVQVKEVLKHFNMLMMQIPGQPTTDTTIGAADQQKALGAGAMLGKVLDKGIRGIRGKEGKDEHKTTDSSSSLNKTTSSS